MMAARHDILDEPESLRKPLLSSLGLHTLLLTSLAAQAWLSGSVRERWGDPNSLGGGSVAITPVSKIPIPSRSGLVNPVANDTESRVPQPPPQATPKPAREPEPDAIAIRGRSRAAKKTEIARNVQRYRPPGSDRPNQLYSSEGAAAVSPMFGSTSGSGGVGLNPGSPFGARFGYYEQLLREAVARKWRTHEVDPRLQTAPPVIISFEIQRDGSIRNVRILQRSGNTTLDYSCQRAIHEASPFQPLPAGFERDSAQIEFWFHLKR